MKQAKRVESIARVKLQLSALTAELQTTGLTDKITPEGRILNDISAAVTPLNKRVKHALEIAQSHR